MLVTVTIYNLLAKFIHFLEIMSRTTIQCFVWDIPRTTVFFIIHIRVMVFKNGSSKFLWKTAFSRPFHCKFFKGFLTQILLGQFLNIYLIFTWAFVLSYKAYWNISCSLIVSTQIKKINFDTKSLKHSAFSFTACFAWLKS